MPLDPMMSEAILGTFRNMVEDCKQKNISGDDFDNMCKTFERMEYLAQEHSDMNAFNGQVMQENLYGIFSDFYSRALSNQAKQNLNGNSENFSDENLLKSSVGALKQAIENIKKSYADAIDLASGKHAKTHLNNSLNYIERNAGTLGINNVDEFKSQSEESFKETLLKKPNAYDSSVEVEILQNPDDTIKPIQDLIELGEQSDMTLPKFLRLQIEKGLDKAMEGSITARKALITEQEYSYALAVSPFYIEKIERKIELFDKLASASPFKVPNWKEFSFQRDDIEREFEPLIIKWDTIKNMWDELLWDLYIWSLSYCSFAPYIKPWVLADDPVAATIKTQNVQPGIFKEREKLLLKYFGISFHDIFKHQTFKWDVEYHFISYSQELIEFFIQSIYPNCEPFKNLPQEIIEQRAMFYKRDKNSSDRELNPMGHMPAERFRLYYNKKFGEGRHESKFGEIEKNDSIAAPWNWGNFSYGK